MKKVVTRAQGVLHYIENLTNEWIPVKESVVVRNGLWPQIIPDGPPPPHERRGSIPPYHELRPGERYYWADGALPPPPPMNSSKWDAVKRFLYAYNERTNEVLNDFAGNVWKDRAPGDTERGSAGAFAQDYAINYYWEELGTATPKFRQVGWEPWANEHPGGNHYESATWALEQYLLSGDPLAWQLFSLRVLHLAGQGIDWRTGGIRWEKSPWIFAGTPGQDGAWSHSWPAAIYLYSWLTDELQDVSTLLATTALENPPVWNGWWGIRDVAWYIRALRCAYEISQDRQVKAFGLNFINSVLDMKDSLGEPYFPNFGGPIDSWQQWLMLSEAQGFATAVKDTTIYPRLKPIAQWLLANVMVASTEPHAHDPNGFVVSYKWTSVGGPQYTSFTHTSFSLPMLAHMAGVKDYSWAKVQDAINYILGHLPESQGFSGLRWRPEWCNQPSCEDPRWGSGAPKIASMAMYGLRPTILAYAGN
tara:strand:+ start:242 stop:1669 length:1428 start_codon:yes stop_codon:yes gene_type:complete